MAGREIAPAGKVERDAGGGLARPRALLDASALHAPHAGGKEPSNRIAIPLQIETPRALKNVCSQAARARR